MRIILQWIALSVAVYLSAEFLDGVILHPWYIALIVGASLSFIYLIVKPIITILTLPLNILTLGIFPLIVNALLFWFLGTIIDGFSVTSFWSAFIGSFGVSIIYWLSKKALKNYD